jgi:hypothetical protein
MIISLGLLLGSYFLSSNKKSDKVDQLKTPIQANETSSRKEISPETKLNHLSSDQASEVKNLEPKKKSKINKDLENTKAQAKEIGDEPTSQFNPKTQVRYEIIEGYAIAAEDILLGRPKDPNQTVRQTVLRDDILTWPNAEVPFAFDASLPAATKTKIIKALEQFADQTAVRFLEYSGYEKDFIVFTKAEDLCASYVGRVGGAQPILLGSKCQVAEIMHELMHALGFIHEHQRDIRDAFLKINFNNIEDDKLINFDVMPDIFQSVYKNVYDRIDLKSLLIYPSNAFVTEPSLKSIEILGSEDTIKENFELSRGDIDKIQNLYFRKF